MTLGVFLDVVFPSRRQLRGARFMLSVRERELAELREAVGIERSPGMCQSLADCARMCHRLEQAQALLDEHIEEAKAVHPSTSGLLAADDGSAVV